MSDEKCPECGQDFEVVWGVTVGDAGGYRPVFGGPVAFDAARCDQCQRNFERKGDEPWLRRGTN